jgi:hypothetical protein
VSKDREGRIIDKRCAAGGLMSKAKKNNTCMLFKLKEGQTTLEEFL